MQIISHRGYWIQPNEKNSIKAFERSFSLGFGTETDIRDYNGELVIAHDIANEYNITVQHFFELYNKYQCTATLALNIKADGLQQKLMALLQSNNITNYFVFDMSVPDTLGYLNGNVNFFSRQSEYEQIPIFYNQTIGIWLDSFNTIWYNNAHIIEHISQNKQVAIVSPELHKRDFLPLWNQLKALTIPTNNIVLCTDTPEQAKAFFTN
jgi:glycerophosphoryl diester phosphodiesterase